MKVSLSSILLLLVNLALAMSFSQAFSLETSSSSSNTAGRRSFFASALIAAGSVVTLPSVAQAVGMGKVGGDPSVFCGTYSDPINHPGGKRTITLLEGGKTGDYQLAQVQGGGGIGEPENYILPAVILGDRSIIIDFSPKGGPRDFVGVLDGKDIKFLRDGNRWPRVS
eukprot:CAMPEP_0113618506 /NCGR_PEP_ID=MMETSP0017_2-20120614/9372_1 /TAXON_ID=2856 /ORGANISM="Cylindrotheca closterium" /LENGTH=167 /DNA_ID=CAMNT_0000528017 /DNA_START=110 /DNA_END=613 /DNA_ORIENTATION=- /assembly_acc=CAM_ASM_000147